MEYYSAFKKKNIPPFSTLQVELEDILQTNIQKEKANGISQVQSKLSTHESRKKDGIARNCNLEKGMKLTNGTKLVNLEMIDVDYMEWADHFINDYQNTKV